MKTTPENIIQLISKNKSCVQFGELENGTSPEWISKTEHALKLKLPESYKWFLKAFGGGEIAGEEIFSIYEIEFESAVGGDIVFVNLAKRKAGCWDPSRILICDNNGEELFYFLTQPGLDDNGEYAVWRIDRIEGSDSLYASDFLEFLQKRIQFLCN